MNERYERTPGLSGLLAMTLVAPLVALVAAAAVMGQDTPPERDQPAPETAPLPTEAPLRILYQSEIGIVVVVPDEQKRNTCYLHFNGVTWVSAIACVPDEGGRRR